MLCWIFSGGKRERMHFSPCYHRPSIFHPFKTYILCMFSFLHTFYVNLKWVSNEKTRRVSDEASSQCNILPTQDLVSLPSASSLKTFSFFLLLFRECIFHLEMISINYTLRRRKHSLNELVMVKNINLSSIVKCFSDQRHFRYNKNCTLENIHKAIIGSGCKETNTCYKRRVWQRANENSPAAKQMTLMNDR